MSVSYQGIGAWCATFACEDVAEGETVKLSASGAVESCDEGDAFCGVVCAVGHDGAACSVQLGGLAEIAYSGTAPTVGMCALTADGEGGVAVAGSNVPAEKYLVCAVDTTAKIATIKL